MRHARTSNFKHARDMCQVAASTQSEADLRVLQPRAMLVPREREHNASRQPRSLSIYHLIRLSIYLSTCLCIYLKFGPPHLGAAGWPSNRGRGLHLPAREGAGSLLELTCKELAQSADLRFRSLACLQVRRVPGLRQLHPKHRRPRVWVGHRARRPCLGSVSWCQCRFSDPRAGGLDVLYDLLVDVLHIVVVLGGTTSGAGQVVVVCSRERARSRTGVRPGLRRCVREWARVGAGGSGQVGRTRAAEVTRCGTKERDPPPVS